MHVDTKLPKVGTTIFTVMSQLAMEHKAVNLGQGFPDFPVPEPLALREEPLEFGRGMADAQGAPFAIELPPVFGGVIRIEEGRDAQVGLQGHRPAGLTHRAHLRKL